MARRHFGFKPSPRKEQLGFASALEFMAGAAPAYKQEAAQAEVARMRERIPAAPKPRAAPRLREAAVIGAISDLLRAHPRVIWAARFNSGMVSYESTTGLFAPVWFHKFLRSPEKMRMPDFLGLTGDQIPDWGKPYPFKWIAIEAKAPGWTKPRDDREREQSAFLAMVRSVGGIGIFATDAAQVAEALR